MNNELAQAEEAPSLEYVTFKGAESPKKTFFYELIEHRNYSGYIDSPENNQAQIIAVSENEAATLNQNKWRQVGVGDGSHYAKTIQNCGVRKGERIPIERARKIMQDAFDAELQAARGHYERPVLQTYHFMGASPGTQGYEDLIRRKQ